MALPQWISTAWESAAAFFGRQRVWVIVLPGVGLIAFSFFFEPLTWALAAFACGALLGFLFGIPRVTQAPVQRAESASGASRSPVYWQSVNTNMEAISDWLTKIIVGVGLVELNNIPAQFESLARFLAGTACDPGFVGSVLVLFGVAGFLSGYIATRLVLAPAFSEADQSANRFNEEAAELPPDAPDSAESVSTVVGNQLQQVAMASPEAAVLASWGKLYEKARETLKTRLPTERVPKLASGMIEQLRAKALLTAEEADTFEKLRQMRNLAAHSVDAGITVRAALDYANSAEALIRRLESSLSNPASTPAGHPT